VFLAKWLGFIAALYGLYAAAVLLWHPVYGAITVSVVYLIAMVPWMAWFSYNGNKEAAARERVAGEDETTGAERVLTDVRTVRLLALGEAKIGHYYAPAPICRKRVATSK
jgi:hypothetical protein